MINYSNLCNSFTILSHLLCLIFSDLICLIFFFVLLCIMHFFIGQPIRLCAKVYCNRFVVYFSSKPTHLLYEAFLVFFWVSRTTEVYCISIRYQRLTVAPLHCPSSSHSSCWTVRVGIDGRQLALWAVDVGQHP